MYFFYFVLIFVINQKRSTRSQSSSGHIRDWNRIEKNETNILLIYKNIVFLVKQFTICFHLEISPTDDFPFFVRSLRKQP